MKTLVLTLAVVFSAGFAFAADNNYGIIGKVMEDAMKGKASYFGKVKEGTAKAEDYTALYEMVRTLRGTEAPVGEQAAYDEKVEVLIRAAGVTAYTDPTDATIAVLKDAANCKACHESHKPD